MKKIILLIATIAMMFALTGCVGKATTAEHWKAKTTNIEDSSLAERIVVERNRVAKAKGEFSGSIKPGGNLNKGQEFGMNLSFSIIGLPVGIPLFLVSSLFPAGGQLDKHLEVVRIEQERLDKLTPEEIEGEEKALAQRIADRRAKK